MAHTVEDQLRKLVREGMDIELQVRAGVLQLERQLRLLIEAVEAYLDVNNWASLGELKARVRQNLEDRLETAKGHLA